MARKQVFVIFDFMTITISKTLETSSKKHLEITFKFKAIYDGAEILSISYDLSSREDFAFKQVLTNNTWFNQPLAINGDRP